MPWYLDYKRRPAPKAAPGATRKEYGATWWGRQWLNALANIDYSNRLPRGKTYANKGLAHDLVLSDNIVSAKVTGSMPKPYKVDLALTPFSPETRKNLIKIVTENPLFLSKLLNRELPVELHEALKQHGIQLFPTQWKDVEGRCSCPDWAVPCKHMAAVFFLIANEIDKNPFLVFELRKVDLLQALKESGYTESESTSFSISAAATLQQLARTTLPDWQPDETLRAAIDFSNLPECQDSLLPLLSDKPVFYPEGNFKKELATAYKYMAKGINPADSEISKAELNAFRKSEKPLLLLDASNGAFISATLLDVHDQSVLAFNSMLELIKFLKYLPEAEVALSSPQIRGLHLAFRLADMLARKGAFVPQILQNREGASYIRFIPARLNDDVRAVCEQVSALLPPGMLVYVDDEQEYEPTDADALNTLTALFLGWTSGLYQLQSREFNPRHFWFFTGKAEPFATFETREYPKSVHLWLSRFFMTEKSIVPVFEVQLKGDDFEVTVSMEDRQQAFQAPVPLQEVLDNKKHAAMRLDALRDLTMVSEFFPELNGVIASNGKNKLLFNSLTFAQIFYKALPIIRLLGIRVLLPKELQKIFRPAMSMSLSAANKGKISGTGLLSFANMIDFEWQVALGDQQLSPDEFAKLVKNMRGIVRLADGFVFLEEQEIASLMKKIQQAPRPSGPKLLQVALSGEYQGMQVRLTESARALIAELLRPDSAPLPSGLQAQLRPYQVRGYEWLYKNTRLGLGSLIADDMGLGKTLQVIATLLRLKEEGTLGENRQALVVVPTTLLTNWTREITRFAPGLQAQVYHGAARVRTLPKEADVILTTYGMLRSDAALFQKPQWQMLVLDEAQNIKNLNTVQTKEVKKLKASVRIAMTGTPVENRLSEYYSLFDFTNHGYLGPLKTFTEEFAKPIELERNHAVLSNFQRATAPFLLRRVKTDKSIISDLPDKVETNQYCFLSKEQAALYQNVVDTSLKAISDADKDSIQRQGLVLKMLTALKQICNHPAHYLKKKEADPAHSGKAQRLLDIMGEILETGEKTLIFTQYREMGDLLIPMLQEHLGVEAAFLHGGVSRAARDKMVEDFQQRPTARVLLLSLKAGGTGLNLTAASNVIHYDLWWNPAVEAQATDRAYRIGQHRNVQVHRFITQSTFEERINTMIQSKKELANLAVTAGEKWVGDLSDKELKELVRLG
ncbi:MAG: DEAD/DEAH box helicase family protein [Saprospiraceae bacterium]|nr:DEAD/DEAH box helicase family protein [Saprospiraceae bacterium]